MLQEYFIKGKRLSAGDLHHFEKGISPMNLMGNFGPNLLCSTAVVQPHWRFWEHELLFVCSISMRFIFGQVSLPPPSLRNNVLCLQLLIRQSHQYLIRWSLGLTVGFVSPLFLGSLGVMNIGLYRHEKGLQFLGRMKCLSLSRWVFVLLMEEFWKVLVRFTIVPSLLHL